MSTLTPPCSAETWPSSDVPGAEGDDRRAVAGADADDRRGLLGARRVDDGVGGGGGVKRLVDAVLVAHVAPGQHAVGAEQRAQVVEQLLGGGVGQAPVLL